MVLAVAFTPVGSWKIICIPALFELFEVSHLLEMMYVHLYKGIRNFCLGLMFNSDTP